MIFSSVSSPHKSLLLLILLRSSRRQKRCFRFSATAGAAATPRASKVPAEFVRSKPHLNVGTIGHVDHGKTSLTSAITKVLSASNLAAYQPYEAIDNCPDEKRRGITINARHVEYETPRRHYAHVDCPGHIDFVKNMITGAFQTDGAILVLAADAGIMPQTREHIILARQMGLAKLIVYLNKADLVDEATIQLCEEEIREMLHDYGFDGVETPVVVGSAKRALEEAEEEGGNNNDNNDNNSNNNSNNIGKDSILRLLDTMDDYMEVPRRRDDLPALLPLTTVYSIVGRGTVVAGFLERGVVRKGDAVDLLGCDAAFKATVGSIETFRKSVAATEPGDNIGVLVRGLRRKQLRRGMVLAKPGSAKMANRVKARVYLLDSDEGGLDEPLCPDNDFMLYSRTFNVITNVNQISWAGRSEEDGGGGDDNVGDGSGGGGGGSHRLDAGAIIDRQLVLPGEEAAMELMLMRRYVFPIGSRFTLRSRMLTVGYGVVTEVLDDADEVMLRKRWKRWKPMLQK